MSGHRAYVGVEKMVIIEFMLTDKANVVAKIANMFNVT